MIFDRVIIDRVFEPAAGWVMDRWGLSHFRIAAECFTLSLAAVPVMALHDLNTLGAFCAVLDIIVLSPAMIVIYGFIRSSIKLDESYDPDRGTMNALAVSETPWRLIAWFNIALFVTAIALMSFDLRDLFGLLHIGAATAAFYFRACHGRPPRRKQRQTKLAWEGA